MRRLLSKYKRLIFIIATLLALGATLWETNRFLQEFKAEERSKMEILASAYQKFNEGGLNDEYTLPGEIINSNKTIPIIIINQDSVVTGSRYLKIKDTLELLKKAKSFATQNKPIRFSSDKDVYQDLYYGNSSLLSKLTYYPLILVGIFLLFISIIYLYYRTGKVSDENRLWSGIAKETAHQIGTPLSSLLGWIEILKTQQNIDIPVEELEKDVQRLNVISQRFSKIGSRPTLNENNIADITRKTLHYIKDRTSKLIEFKTDFPNEVMALANPQLYSWVIENLIKNAIDAMEGKGLITLSISEDHKHVFIDVSDTGKGIASSKYKEVFKAGYTTKKRGWGLGLSLAKRIIEQYHKGRIFVKSSKIDGGTTFRIVLNKPQR